MSQAQAISAEPAVRASDAERDQAAEILRVAYAEGRLTRDELDERIGAAYAAKTRADLSGLTSDLPGAISAQQAHRRTAVPDLPATAPAPGARIASAGPAGPLCCWWRYRPRCSRAASQASV
jgi:hypothetical protein